MLPFCYFAFQRSWTGVMASVLALLTSMMWFWEPAKVSPQVQAFLVMEQQYLTQDWTVQKALLMLTIPLFFSLVGWAFWRRRLAYGLLVLLLGAVIKIIWSVWNDAESGTAILPAAMGGMVLVVLAILVWRYFQEN